MGKPAQGKGKKGKSQKAQNELKGGSSASAPNEMESDNKPADKRRLERKRQVCQFRREGEGKDCCPIPCAFLTTQVPPYRYLWTSYLGRVSLERWH